MRLTTAIAELKIDALFRSPLTVTRHTLPPDEMGVFGPSKLNWRISPVAKISL